MSVVGCLIARAEPCWHCHTVPSLIALSPLDTWSYLCECGHTCHPASLPPSRSDALKGWNLDNHDGTSPQRPRVIRPLDDARVSGA